jgi:hypothetical protein
MMSFREPCTHGQTTLKINISSIRTIVPIKPIKWEEMHQRFQACSGPVQHGGMLPTSSRVMMMLWSCQCNVEHQGFP